MLEIRSIFCRSKKGRAKGVTVGGGEGRAGEEAVVVWGECCGGGEEGGQGRTVVVVGGWGSGVQR